MNKLVFVLPDMPGGGTERVVALLANEYAKKGYAVSIMLFAGRQCSYPLDPRIEIYIAGEESKGDLLIRIKRLVKMRKYYKKNRGCCILAFSVMGAVFSRVATVGISCRLIVSERNDPSRYQHQRIRNWAYKKAEKIILQTEEVMNYFPHHMMSKMIVIPNPVSESIMLRYEGERKHQVVAVGRLETQKNHRLLINAFEDFLKDYPEYLLYIFGVGQLEQELRNQVKELGIEKSVIFKGFASNVLEQIWDSKMFVLSSDYEGISNAMIEALAVGVPVIATDCPVGGARMYITNDDNGLLIPVGDKEALVCAMKRLAEDDELTEKLSINGTKIKEQYSIQNIADIILKEIGLE